MKPSKFAKTVDKVKSHPSAMRSINRAELHRYGETKRRWAIGRALFAAIVICAAVYVIVAHTFGAP